MRRSDAVIAAVGVPFAVIGWLVAETAEGRFIAVMTTIAAVLAGLALNHTIARAPRLVVRYANRDTDTPVVWNDRKMWAVLVVLVENRGQAPARAVEVEFDHLGMELLNPTGNALHPEEVNIWVNPPRFIARYESEHRADRLRLKHEGESVWSLTAWANTVSTSSTGKPWNQRTLRGMLLSPALAGIRVYKEQRFEGTWDPILDRQRWEAVEALLRDPARVTRGGRPAPWLLAGLVKCGRCEQTMVVHYRPKARGGAREYTCMPAPGRPSCGKTTAIAEPLEAIIEEVVLQELADDRLAKALEQQGGEVQELHAQRRVVKAKLREVGEMYDTDEIDRPEYLDRRAKLLDRLEKVQHQLDQVLQRSVLADLPTAEEELRSWWRKQATAEQKQSVVRACLSSVVVGPVEKRVGPKFDPDRLLPPHGPQWRI